MGHALPKPEVSSFATDPVVNVKENVNELPRASHAYRSKIFLDLKNEQDVFTSHMELAVSIDFYYENDDIFA